MHRLVVGRVGETIDPPGAADARRAAEQGPAKRLPGGHSRAVPMLHRLVGAAVEAAVKLDRIITDAMAREIGAVQPIKQAPYFAHAQFSDPATILALPEPADDFPFLKASWHYARVLAYIARGDLAEARAEAKALSDLAAGDFTKLTAWAVPAPDVVAIAREVANGRLARAEGRPRRSMPSAVRSRSRTGCPTWSRPTGTTRSAGPWPRPSSPPARSTTRSRPSATASSARPTTPTPFTA